MFPFVFTDYNAMNHKYLFKHCSISEGFVLVEASKRSRKISCKEKNPCKVFQGRRKINYSIA